MVAGSDGKAHQKAVKLGIRQDDDVQIVDGLTESDKVVATGAYGLPDNTKITVEAPAEKESPKEGEKDSAGEKKDSGDKGDKKESADKDSDEKK
jgi:hypothetical protein